MSMHAQVAEAPSPDDSEYFLTSYLETLAMVERLHRLLLDVVKDEFEMNDLGKTMFCLGLWFKYILNGIFIHQMTFIDKCQLLIQISINTSF